MGIFSRPKAAPAPPPPPAPAPIKEAEDPKKKKARGLPDTMSPTSPALLGTSTEPNTSVKTLLGQ